MFKNHLTIACRILLRQRVFSLINILGLAVGMAACLLIVQYMSFELSYDNFHANGQNIYRIKHQRYEDGALTENMPLTYSAAGPVLKSAFPEVVRQTRLATGAGMVSALQPGGGLLAFNEPNIYYTEGSFLHMFSFPMVKGTASALDRPNAVVITESAAKKYFPGQDPVGKTLTIQEQVSGTDITAMVTGVCRDVPANSHLQFNFLVSQNMQQGDWVYPEYYTYIQLAPGTKAKAFEAKLAPYINKNIAGLSKNNSSSNTQGKSNLAGLTFALQPLRDMHLYSNLPQELTPGVSGRLVWFLGIIALLILSIAYINYLNLSTAKVIERAKEVGIRKVLGSQRVQLIKQFLLESLILNGISLIAAVGITLLCMPWFSRLCGVDMQFTIWKNYLFAPAFAGLLLLGVMVSALYPAVVLSACKPVQILKGKFLAAGKNFTLRKALVVFQFTATVAFIAGTLIVYRQINYMQTENTGMDMKQTLVVTAPKNIRATDEDGATYAHKDTVFQQEVVRNAGVQGITASSSIPGESIGYIMQYTSHPQGSEPKNERLATMEISSGF
ncbi:MAG TPA: ABC transporter permease, partial [Chitinophagaceae bacterium]|nr:ABC transporter permease [Chitinophagaceae bacterium]